MKMFLLKSVFLACLMFISVLFGMQQANEGIVRMKGYGHEQFQSPITINEKEEGRAGGIHTWKILFRVMILKRKKRS